MNSDERQRALWDAMNRWLAYLDGRGAAQRDALAPDAPDDNRRLLNCAFAPTQALCNLGNDRRAP